MNLGDANRILTAWGYFGSPGFTGVLAIGAELSRGAGRGCVCDPLSLQFHRRLPALAHAHHDRTHDRRYHEHDDQQRGDGNDEPDAAATRVKWKTRFAASAFHGC